MNDRFGTAVRRLAMACTVEGLDLAGSTSATLLDRGPDLVYDNVLNITWTRNANLTLLSPASQHAHSRSRTAIDQSSINLQSEIQRSEID